MDLSLARSVLGGSLRIADMYSRMMPCSSITNRIGMSTQSRMRGSSIRFSDSAEPENTFISNGSIDLLVLAAQLRPRPDPVRPECASQRAWVRARCAGVSASVPRAASRKGPIFFFFFLTRLMTRRAREALMANAGARFRGRVYIAPPEPSTPSCSSPDYLTTHSRKRSRRGVKRRRNKSSRPTQLVRKSLGDFEFATDECQLFLQSIGLSAQIPGCDDVVSLSQGNRGDESTGASPPTPLQICEESEQTETPISAKRGITTSKA